MKHETNKSEKRAWGVSSTRNKRGNFLHEKTRAPFRAEHASNNHFSIQSCFLDERPLTLAHLFSVQIHADPLLFFFFLFFFKFLYEDLLFLFFTSLELPLVASKLHFNVFSVL